MNSWRYNKRCFTLDLISDKPYYSINLRDGTVSSQVLDWIMQVANKSWATPKILADLVWKINEVLDPQSTLCSCGQNLELNVEKYLWTRKR